jgi:hypothetical protein
MMQSRQGLALLHQVHRGGELVPEAWIGAAQVRDAIQALKWLRERLASLDGRPRPVVYLVA